MRWWGMVGGVLWSVAAAGCSRSATLNVAELRALNGYGERGLRVERSAGEPLTFESYDTLQIETKDRSAQALANPVRARVVANRLIVADREGERRFELGQVEQLTLREHAPERGWIILAAAGAGLVGGGLVGAAAVGECHAGEDFCGQGRGAAALLGATVGLGLGLGLSIPMTAELSPIPSAASLATTP